MSQHLIKLFMWGYQPHYRFSVEYLLKLTLQELGAEDVGGKCLLVGAKMPNAKVAHDVCVEPEDGQWPVCVFRAKLDTDSAANWTVIPAQTGHGFHGKLDT
jgi:hypothetical protein